MLLQGFAVFLKLDGHSFQMVNIDTFTQFVNDISEDINLSIDHDVNILNTQEFSYCCCVWLYIRIEIVSISIHFKSAFNCIFFSRVLNLYHHSQIRTKLLG